MISVKNNIVYYKTYDKVVAYDVDKQTKEEMDYMITSAVVETCMANGKIVIVGDGCVDMIDFDKKKVKKSCHKQNVPMTLLPAQKMLFIMVWIHTI